MRKALLCIAAATALCAPTAARAAADPIYGVWVREGHPDDKLEFYDCAGKLCAKGTEPMPDGSPAPEILRNAAKVATNNWKGDLFNPENGKMYKGEITLDSPTQLTLTGCLVAFLCQSETWTRVSGPTKPAEAPAGKAAAPAHDAAPKAGAKDSAKEPAAKEPAAKEPAAKEPAAKEPAAKEPAKPAAKPAKPTAPAKPAAPAKPKPPAQEPN